MEGDSLPYLPQNSLRVAQPLRSRSIATQPITVSALLTQLVTSRRKAPQKDAHQIKSGGRLPYFNIGARGAETLGR